MSTGTVLCRVSLLKLTMLLTAVLLLPSLALAQADQADILGIPPDAAIYSIPGVGFVNLRNGNLHIEESLEVVKDRNGTPLTTSIVYDNSTWHSVEALGPNGTQVGKWTTGATSDSYGNFGATLSFPLATGSVSNTGSATYECGSSSIPQYSGWQYVDPHGTIHPFPHALLTERSGGTGCPDLPVAQGAATDGSGYWLEVSNYQTAAVYDMHGNQMVRGADTNGNFVPSGSYDKLGRTVLLPSGFTPVYKTIYVWTAFGYEEYGPISATVLSSLTLPDGRSYSFQYDDAGAPAGANGTFLSTQQGHYGSLTGLTLPTGGHITISSGVVSSAGTSIGTSFAVKQIATPDGTWSFTYAPATNTGGVISPGKITATAPVNPSTGLASQTTWLNDVVSTYAGTATGSPLRTTTTTGYPGPPVAVTTVLDNGQSNRVAFTYADACTPRVTSKKEYDFSGSLIRETDATYLTSASDNTNLCKQLNTVPAWTSAYLQGTHHVTDIVSNVTVYGAGGCCSNPVSQTNYTYDSTGLTTTSGTAGASVLGLASHDDTNFGSTMTLRGNPTVISQMTTPGTLITTKTNTYNILGELVQTKDGKGNATSFDYTDSWNDASCLPHSVFAYATLETNALGQRNKTTYNSCDGSTASTKDQNDINAGRAGTVYSYDGLRRPTKVASSDGGSTSIAYGGSANPEVITTTIAATASSTYVSSSTLDGLGRTTKAVAASGATVSTVFDALGQIHSVSNPYFNTTDGNYGVTTYSYDALRRTTSQQNPDSTLKTWGYSGPSTKMTDEAKNSWTDTHDALGRLIKVIEPTGASTSYVYSPLGDLTSTTQYGVSGETARTRSFTYDSMSRLLTATNPETGTVCYGQLSGGNCMNGYDTNGNLVAKTDGRGVVMNYYYDALNRLTNKQSTGGTNVGIVNFLYTYDSTTTAVTNGVGRLVATANGNGESELYGYDPLGRATSESIYLPSTPKAAATVSALYDLAGNMTNLTYPDGRHITQSSDSAGRLSGSKLVDIHGTAPASPQIYAQSITYFSNGTPAVLTLGDAVAQTATENNRLQINGFTISSLANAHSGQVTYCYYANCATSGTGNNGNILSIVDGLNAVNTQAFTYDSLNRINTFSLGGTLSQQYSIDSFGDLSGVVGGKATMTFAPTTNRISNLPCAASVAAFDAVGNQLCSTTSSGAVIQYQFDAEDRASQIASLNTSTPFETYIYAADGGRARKSNTSGTYTEYVRFGGMSLAERDQSGVWTDHIYANGKQIVSTTNSDTRLHLSGVSPTGAASSNQASGTFNLPYMILTGDALAFRMYSHNATAAVSISFTDGSSLPSSGSTCGIDQTGQCLSTEKVSNAWVNRIVNLGAIANGKTISHIALKNGPTAPAGQFDLMIADFVIISGNGTITQLIGDLPLVACTPTGTTGMASLSCVSERVTSPSDFAGTPQTARYYLSDHLGTAQLELTAGGWPLWRGHFSPFGQEIDILATSNNYKFTGKERDQESGLDYFGARYYGSNMGRFMSPDYDDGWGPSPVPSADFENPQSLNLYSYVHNNPLTNDDPDGHDVQVCDNNGQCNTVSNSQYRQAQQGNNGGLNVPTLDQVGSNGNGSGQFNSSNISDSSGNSVGTATYLSNGGADYYANANGYNQLANTSQVVKAGTAIYVGVYGAVGAAIVGGEVAAGTAAARSQIVFRLAHGTGLKALLDIGHNVPIAEIGEIKNAIAAAVASGAISSLGGNAFQGVVNVAGTFLRFTGATTPTGQTVISNVMGNALQK